MKNRCNRFSSLVIFGLLLLSATAPLHALDFGDWGRKAEITFSGYEGTETLTNFPALVVLGPGTITGFAYDDSPDGGADLRFSDSTGLVELPYEIEQWNPAGKSYVWVRIPELVDANTSIWAYWNRAGQTAPDYTTNGAVWANGSQAVWHLGESGSTRNDATAHGNTGSLVGNTSSLSGGAVAGASEFDGAGDYINDGALAAINGSSRLTVSGWVNLTTLGVADNNDDSCLFSRGPGSPAILLWYNVNQDGTDQNHVYTFHVGNTSTLADRINGNKGLAKAGQWQHVVGVMNGGARKLYVDGRWDKTTSGGATAVPADTSSLRLGSWSQGTTMDFKGGMDEVRISNVERSAVWIMSEYLTVASNTVFQTYGAAQSAAPGMPSAATGIATNIAASSAWLCGSLTSTGGSATAAIAYWGTTDAGTNAAGWAASATLAAPQSEGAFSIPATELSADSTYYYRVAASNDTGVAWASSGAFFITGELTLAKTSDADEATLTSGAFTVSRPGTATNEALIVTYAQTGGTAVPGVDYAALPGSVTIPAGSVSAPIDVTPLKNYALQSNTTLELSLAGAAAVVGAASNATMTIVNQALQSTVFVSAGGDNSDGLTWETALNDLQAALSLAAVGGTVHVAGGQTFTLNSQLVWPTLDGIALVGGYEASGVEPGARDPAQWPTTITRNPANNIRLMQIAGVTNTVLSGLTLTGGNIVDQRGGALHVSGSGLTLDDCVVTNNRASTALTTGGSVSGGALFAQNSTVVVKGCRLVGNTAASTARNNTAHGGALAFSGGVAVLSDCDFRRNTAWGEGSGAHMNSDWAYGGAVYTDGKLVLTNCVLIANHARIGSLGTGRGEHERREGGLFRQLRRVADDARRSLRVLSRRRSATSVAGVLQLVGHQHSGARSGAQGLRIGNDVLPSCVEGIRTECG